MIMKAPASYFGGGFQIEFDDIDIDQNEADGIYEDDFSEYLWMENEEEFDKTEMQRLEEEALMEQCIEAMLDDEQLDEQAQKVDEALEEYAQRLQDSHFDENSKEAKALEEEYVKLGLETLGSVSQEDYQSKENSCFVDGAVELFRCLNVKDDLIVLQSEESLLNPLANEFVPSL